MAHEKWSPWREAIVRNREDDIILASYTDAFVQKEFDFFYNGLRQALQVETDPSVVEGLYRLIPGKLPPLYERVILSYRWPEVVSYRVM